MASIKTVALIGCGNRQRAHVPGLLADQRCKIVGLSDVKVEAAEAIKKDFSLDAATFSDHKRMLAAMKPDVVVSCLWTPLHLPVFGDCVAAGVKAVMSEKPMAPTYADCLAMAKLAESSKVMLTFCHQRRFSKGNQLVRRMLEEGLFGKIERMDLYSPPNLLDCGTHTLDQAFSFNRETPVKWVLGTLDATEPLNWFSVSSENLFVGNLVFDNGVRANIQCGGPDMDIWGGVRVTGSDGFVEVMWDGEIKRAVRYKEAEWQPPRVEDKSDEFVGRMIKDVLDCVDNGGRAGVVIQEGTPRSRGDLCLLRIRKTPCESDSATHRRRGQSLHHHAPGRRVFAEPSRWVEGASAPACRIERGVSPAGAGVGGRVLARRMGPSELRRSRPRTARSTREQTRLWTSFPGKSWNWLTVSRSAP